jgi:hypothetical protein
MIAALAGAIDSKGPPPSADVVVMGVGETHLHRAAAQHIHGTIPPAARPPPLWNEHPPWVRQPALLHRMTDSKPRQVFIQGITRDGKTFRPSDWAERLCGAMSCFRPEGAGGGIAAFIGYSPYCVPRVINGVKCVIVNERLRDVEPMAWDFVMNFARDNALQHSDACLLPEPPEPGA